jgi:hypothetical protein
VDDASSDRGLKSEPEPVTMAVAAAQSSAASRWTAVAVSVAPEESSIVLEHEMRKVYAAYAAYDGAVSRPSQEIPSVAEAQAAVVASVPAETAAPVETPQPSTGSTTAQAFEAASSSSIAAPTADELSVRVKSFETVGASSEVKPDESKRDEFKSDEVKPGAAEAASAPLAEAAAFASETQPVAAPAMETRASEITTAQQTNPESVHEAVAPDASGSEKHEEPATPKAELEHIHPAHGDPAHGDPTHVEQVHVEAAHEEPVHDNQVQQEPTKYPEPFSVASAVFTSAVAAEGTPAIRTENEEVEAPAASRVADPEAPAASAEPVVSSDQAAPVVQDGSSKDRASHDVSHQEGSGKEPDIAATTAAAWASWRRIRESGNPKDASESDKPEESSSASSDEAAMAVAAGAETAPEGPEIASIVDSVLADLRPKIMEEISKKFKKK